MTGAERNHRLNHIFRENGKTLIVAMDHGSVFGTMDGLEKPGEVIQKVRSGGADAILTTYGVGKQFVKEIGDMGLILRVDGGHSALAPEWGPLQLVYQVQDALRLGADAVGTMGMPGSQFQAQTLPYLSELIGQCAEWNMPVLAEMLPGGFESPETLWTPENVADACRIGAELGADIIKTTYTGDVNSFARLVEQVYVPIVVLGGTKSDDPRYLLEMIHGAMQAGARGVACGRNIYQWQDPAKMVQAVAAIIHDGATVDAALDLLNQ
ncbi:MAG: aldolase [Anaerolineae bacterium]|nr:aldolase [Anaerolineae bacterium]